MSVRATEPVCPMGLSEIAEQFKVLDSRRRIQGLTMREAETYRTLYERMSEILASGERHRKAENRQFLRVPFPMLLVVRRAEGEVHLRCQNFGGGGCGVQWTEEHLVDEEVYVDGVWIGGQHYPLHGRAVIQWAKSPGETGPDYGLRFCIESPDMRDQIDRVLYRALDIFFNGAPSPRPTRKRTERRAHL